MTAPSVGWLVYRSVGRLVGQFVCHNFLKVSIHAHFHTPIGAFVEKKTPFLFSSLHFKYIKEGGEIANFYNGI